MVDELDLRSLIESMPFASSLGIELESATAEEVVGRLAWSEERCTVAGALHGGALMTLADSVGAICAFLNLPPDSGTATIESKTNFFRGVRAGHVTAVARPLHVGRTTIAVETQLRDDEARRVALVIQTQAIIYTG